ncbi:unnamed protein product [Pieris macdunnoughi]|uniref:Leucine-rich repeat-containing protein 71 n=1 Tax=Pieris macdunnoughi TaxID=345717 RepID=A0A821VDW6_9NEOP|nr:unnamed protein product [Pieris macdunnoughi]
MTEECPRPSPDNIVEFLPYICYTMQAPFGVQLKTRIVEEYVSVIDKAKKTKKDKSTIHALQQDPEPGDTPASDVQEGGVGLVAMTALYNASGRLVELLVNRSPVPTMLIRVLTLCLPFQPHLYRLTVCNGVFETKTLAAISQLLVQSQITELYLSDSPVPGHRFSQLLAYQTRLQCLSLDRCGLDDDDCIEIASMLTHPNPASQTLLVLSMGSNNIYNRGAVALAVMLRSNRKLRYLNLSGNQISNTGAAAIFGSLMEFPLSHADIVSKRLRVVQYIKLRKEVYAKCYNDLIATASDSKSEARRKPTTRRKSVSTGASLSPDELAAKADVMTTHLIGPFNEPFTCEATFKKEGAVYSYGNLCLSYLNMSYNNLNHPSAVTLAEAIQAQQRIKALTATTEVGLVRVQLEGNPLPADTDELDTVQAMLDRAMLSGSKGRKSEKFLGRLSRR